MDRSRLENLCVAGGMLALAAALGAWHLRALGGIAFPLDDAYIVLHNVEALKSGADANFPGTPALVGSTSLLHTFALVAASWIVTPLAGLWALSWLGVFAIALGAERIARALALGWAWRIGLPVAVATAGHPLLVLVNGLETGWAVAGALWAFALALERSRFLALVCGALPFVRPELGALSMLLMGARLFDGLRSGERAAFARDLAVFLGVVALGVAATFAISGQATPSTGSAKGAFFSRENATVLQNIASFVTGLGPFLLFTAPLSIAIALPRGRVAALATMFAALVLIVYAMRYPNIAAQNFLRYFYILVPVFAVNLACLAASQRRFLRLGAGGLLAAAVLVNLYGLPAHVAHAVPRAANKHTGMAGVAHWVEDHLDPAKPLLLHDVGFVSWATDQRMIDLVGLKSPASIDVHRRVTHRLGWGWDGVGAALDEIAAKGRACYLLVSGSWDAAIGMTHGLREHGWRLEDLSGPDGVHGYRFYGLAPPGEPFPECA